MASGMVVQTFRPAENRWAICSWDLASLQFVGATGGLPSIYRHFATCELCGERTQQARKIGYCKSRFIGDVSADLTIIGIRQPSSERVFNRFPGIVYQISQGLLVSTK